MEKHTVDLIEYDDNWVRMFEEEKTLLTSVFGDNIIKIEHFGSTSIFGMTAKPIIDIFIFVYDIDKIEQYNSIMESHGYSVRGEEATGCKVFIKHKNNSIKRTHKVNICKEDNPFSRNALLFRDYLRINKDAFHKYKKLKIELSQRYHYDPIAYGEGKLDCVTEILDEAKIYFAK